MKVHAHALTGQLGDELFEVDQGAGEAVDAGHVQFVAVADVGQAVVQAGPVGLRAGGDLIRKPPVDAHRLERVALAGQVLVFAGDARVGDFLPGHGLYQWRRRGRDLPRVIVGGTWLCRGRGDSGRRLAGGFPGVRGCRVGVGVRVLGCRCCALLGMTVAQTGEALSVSRTTVYRSLRRDTGTLPSRKPTSTGLLPG